MPYIEVPVETDPTELADEAFAYIESRIAGWLPSEGNLESWLIEALAQIAGELRALAALVPDEIFQFFGESVLGLVPYAAQAATGLTTWTMIDTAGYTIPAGTLLGLTPSGGGDAFAFQLVSDLVIPAGVLSASGVEVAALEAGASASGLTGSLAMLDQIDYVATVTLDAATSGGSDAEATDAYLNRLSDLATLLSPRPILPDDFAILVQKQIPEVARALAIDLLKGDTGTPNTPRCVSVAVVNIDGQPCSTSAKAAADALLQSEREVNFLAYIIDPTYTSVDVTFDVVSYRGFDPVDVHDRVIAALSSYLSPASWGVPPFGDTSARSWIQGTKVRYLELAEQINRVDGVNFINTLTLRHPPAAFGTADVTLTGNAPMPTAGTITGTVTVGP